MSWDKTKPSDSSKLRNLGVLIRPNWEAIEDGDSTFKPKALNLADRDAAGIVADPTAITDTTILYSKKDGAGNAQAYVIDTSSNVIQLTAGLPIAAGSGSTNATGGIIIKWGFGSATVAGGTITFASVFPNNCWEVILTPQGTTGRSVSVDNKTTANFKAYTSNPCTVGYIAIGN